MHQATLSRQSAIVFEWQKDAYQALPLDGGGGGGGTSNIRLLRSDSYLDALWSYEVDVKSGWTKFEFLVCGV